MRKAFIFVACGAAFACRQHATSTDSRSTEASRSMATRAPDALPPALPTRGIADAATNPPDVVTIDVPTVVPGDGDASSPDAGPLLINASMGAFSIAHGTPSGGGFGADARSPHVNAADATIVGPLDPASVNLMLNNGQRYFRTCYEQGLRRDRRLAGTAVVRVVIGPTGGVTNATVTETTLADRDVASCVASIFRRSRFMSPRDGATAVVTVPFSFEPGTP